MNMTGQKELCFGASDGRVSSLEIYRPSDQHFLELLCGHELSMHRLLDVVHVVGRLIT